MAPHSRIPLSLLPLLVLGCSAGGPPAPAPEAAPAESAEVLPSEEAGYFTQAQSERGREVFQAVCGECHYTSEFRGRDFEWTWRRQTVRNLFDTVVETMPELGFRYGYPLVWVVMLTCAAGMLYYFRRRGWLGRDDD